MRVPKNGLHQPYIGCESEAISTPHGREACDATSVHIDVELIIFELRL